MTDMTDNELIIEIARLRGATIRNIDIAENKCELLAKTELSKGWVYSEDDTGYWVLVSLEGCRWPTSIADAWDLEEEIPRDEDEWTRYTRKLNGIVMDRPDAMMSAEYGDDAHDGLHVFQLIHATPRERCLAWLAWKEAK